MKIFNQFKIKEIRRILTTFFFILSTQLVFGQTYTVTFQTDGTSGSSLIGTTTQVVSSGSNCTEVTAVAPLGFHFVQWNEGVLFISAVNPLIYSNVLANTTLTATFAADPTITTTAGANGSILPSGTVVVSYNGSQPFTITPSVGYHIADVLVDGTSVGPVISHSFTNVIANHTIAATFAINTYNILASVSPVSSGTIIGAGTYNYGSIVNLSATAAAGYSFNNWTEGSTPVSSTATYSYTASADRTLVANFINFPPTATGVTISGTPHMTQVLTGVYTYLDQEGDIQGTSTFRWLRYDAATGGTATVLGVSPTYTIALGDVGKFITFEVTPVAATGTLIGAPVESARLNILNTPPTATGVTISGTPHMTQVLTGVYTYLDQEGDIQGTSTFRWLRYDAATGGTATVLGVSPTYTIALGDVGKFITFEVTPVAATGTLIGAPVESARLNILNTPPTATGVTISGTPLMNQVLTGVYTYLDQEGDIQGTSTFRWLRYDAATGGTATVLGVSPTYTIALGDVGKFITFEVTPVAATGTLIGAPVESARLNILNTPPTATGVTISGTPLMNQVLTGVYTYLDQEGDIQGTSTFRWLRYDAATGGTATVLGVSPTYTIALGDVGKFITFEVTPVAATGTLIGAPVESARLNILNTPPTATGVTISGTPLMNQVLTGVYTYLDQEGDIQGTSTFRWLRYDAATGGTATVLGVSPTYTIALGDVGKFITFEVTPVAATGTLIGAPVESARLNILNTPPTATGVTISGTPLMNQVLTGVYTYLDQEGDIQGTSTFRWLRYDAATGGTATVLGVSPTYTIALGDVGKFITFEVTPVAATGTLIGAPVESARLNILNTPPTATGVTISGTPLMNQVLTGVYTYLDQEGDIQGTSTFRWLRYDAATGGTATVLGVSPTYTIALGDVGKFITFEVTPVAATGTLIGAPVESARLNILNTPPTATGVTISGTPLMNQVLTGVYTYLDQEGDIQGTSTFRWLRYDAATGGTATVLGVSPTYTIALGDVGKFITFEVTPVAATGTLIGAPVESARLGIGNTVPTATAVTITGTPRMNQVLTGNYTYSDLEGDVQGVSTFQWLRYDAATGGTPIEIATTQTYMATLADVGKYLSFTIIPVALTGSTVGLQVESSRIQILNSPPTATIFPITGDLYVCKTLTGHYKYDDVEGDTEKESIYRWYRASPLSLSDTVLIPGANGITYTLTDADIGQYIYFRVTPRASAGATNGVPKSSSPTSSSILKHVPTVTLIAHQNAFCQGKTDTISLVFSGTPLYRLVYTDGTTEHIIDSIPTNTFKLPISKGGTYKVDTLTDKYSCPTTGLTSTVSITINPLPVVDIVGLNNAYSLSASQVPIQVSPLGGTLKGDGISFTSNVYYFKPSDAGVNGSPHAIVYSYTSPTTGCSNADTVKVTIINADAFIKGTRDSLVYCNYEAPITITGGNSKGTIGTLSISGGVGLTDHGNNTATLNPALLQPKDYTISYTYFNNVSLTITKNITITQPATPGIQNISKALYCSNNPRIQLLTTNYPGGTFSGNGVGKNSNNTYYFDPSLATSGKASIKYLSTLWYGCQVVDSMVVQVSKSPLTRFEVQNYCWRKSDSTAFINLTDVSSVNYWEWNYGDNSASASKNTSNKFEQKYLYPLYGDYNVRLIARNTNGCADTIQKNVHLGDIPGVNFSWKNECFISGTPVKFTNQTTFNDPISKYNWVVQDTPNLTYQFNTKDIQHSYPSINSYQVKLVATNETGCKDSTTKTISLRPIYSLKDSSYLNTFESSKNYWYAENTSVNNWSWMTPNGAIIDSAYSGKKAFYTLFTKPRKNEQLVITSPCFNFEGVTKPFIQMWINTNSIAGQEGAVLQYAVDTVKQWSNVGAIGLGINWYNDNAIAASPGGQSNGWSGTSGWIQTRNNLDVVNGQNLIRFRMVYGSTSIASGNGFAFDDVYISRRSKVALLEHFTNISSSAANQSNTDVDNVLQVAGSDAVGIQYHTSFPGADSLNAKNQSDPGARVLYYGVGNIPECFLDGGIDPKYVYDFGVKKTNIFDINAQILKDADYDITIVKDKSSSFVSGTVLIKALKDIDYREVSVYVAVVEDIKVQTSTGVVNYTNVLKKLLPNAAGYSINKSWAKNQEENLAYSWPIQSAYNPKNLKVVVFVQDNSTKEVYQASSVDAGIIVGVQDLISPKNDMSDVTIYPNPVSDLAHIVFAKELAAGYEMIMIDQSGKILKDIKLQQGISEAELEVSGLPDGLYFVRIINSKTGKNKTLKLLLAQ